MKVVPPGLFPHLSHTSNDRRISPTCCVVTRSSPTFYAELCVPTPIANSRFASQTVSQHPPNLYTTMSGFVCLIAVIGQGAAAVSWVGPAADAEYAPRRALLGGSDDDDGNAVDNAYYDGQYQLFLSIAIPLAACCCCCTYWINTRWCIVRDDWMEVDSDECLFCNIPWGICFGRNRGWFTWSPSMKLAILSAFKLFDLMSDWGLYGIELQKCDVDCQDLRRTSLGFCIVGSLLLVFELMTIHQRTADLDSADDVTGKIMLLVVLLEDIPQIGIAGAYMNRAGHGTDLYEISSVAILTMVLSVLNLIYNLAVGCLYTIYGSDSDFSCPCLGIKKESDSCWTGLFSGCWYLWTGCRDSDEDDCCLCFRCYWCGEDGTGCRLGGEDSSDQCCQCCGDPYGNLHGEP